MEKTARDDVTRDGVEFIQGEDGRITAVDRETGVASYGETKVEALRMLAEALELHQGDGDPVTDEDLLEMGLDPDDQGDAELPEFLR